MICSFIPLPPALYRNGRRPKVTYPNRAGHITENMFNPGMGFTFD